MCIGLRFVQFRLLVVCSPGALGDQLPDVWHTTLWFRLFCLGVPRITTIHDLIPIRLPWATLDEKQMFVRLLQESVRNSEYILTVSEHTRQDVLEFTDAQGRSWLVNVHQLLNFGISPLLLHSL